jgi:multiple sugar transport system substrate-binding protein
MPSGRNLKYSRREAISKIGAAAVGAAAGAVIAGVGGYFAGLSQTAPTTFTETVTRTVTQAVTHTVTASPTTTVPPLTREEKFKIERPVELTFWHHHAPPPRQAAIQKAINLFMKEYPMVKVNIVVVPWEEAWPKTLSAIAAGTTPDVEWSIPDLTIAAWEAGGIIPVDDLVKEIDERYKWFENTIRPYYWEGHYWGVPWSTMAWALMYRPSILKRYLGSPEPPRSWDELFEFAKKLTKPEDGVYGIGLTASKTLYAQEAIYNTMCVFDSTIFDQQGKVVFNNPKTIKAFYAYKELFQYSPPGSYNWNWGDIELAFPAGKIAMMPYFTMPQRLFYEEKKGDERKDIAAADWPSPPDGIDTNLHYPNDWFIFKSAAEDENRLNAVKALIMFCARPEIEKILTAEQDPGVWLPPHEAAAEYPGYWEDPVISFFREINEVAIEAAKKGRLYGFEWGAVNTAVGAVSGALVICDVAQRILLQGESVESAVAWGHQAIEEIVAKAKKK